MRKRLALTWIVSINLALLSGCTHREKPEMMTPIEPEAQATVKTTIPQSQSSSLVTRQEVISTPEEAKLLLTEGNERFRNGTIRTKDISFSKRTALAQNGQHPFAVIVSCSDSRVPPEIIFDQALGDLFVIRVAGNVVTPAELGSVEYAVEHLKTPLVLVLGHEQCGAVTAAVEGGEYGGSLPAIVHQIKPSVLRAKEALPAQSSKEELIEKSTEFHVFDTLREIAKSPVIRQALKGNLGLYGAKYRLESGEVIWYDGIDGSNNRKNQNGKG